MGSPCLAICGRRGEQDLFDPALSGGSILVVGWTGCRRCGLLLFLLIFGYICRFQYLAPVDLIAVLYIGRFAILSWPTMYAGSKTLVLLVTSTILLQNVLIFRFNDIPSEERYSRKIGNRVRSREAISEWCRRYPQALFSVCKPVHYLPICLLSQLPGCRCKGIGMMDFVSNHRVVLMAQGCRAEQHYFGHAPNC